MPAPSHNRFLSSQDHDADDDDDGDSSFAPDSLPPPSMIPEDYEDRYGFNSSAESEDSSGLIHHLAQTSSARLLKKRPKIYSPFKFKLSSDSDPTTSTSDYYHPICSSSTLTPPIPNKNHSLDLTPCSQPEFFNSHHLRTSVHSPTSFPIRPPSPTPQSSLAAPSLSLPLGPPSAPRSWFASPRRQKRKHSFHALSHTESSSSASLPLDGPLPSKLDGPAKYAPSTRRSPSGRLRRWSRTLPSVGAPTLLSVRWLRKALSPRQPLGILAGLLLFVAFAVSLTTFLIKFLDTDSTPLPWRTFCQEQREFPHALADSLAPVNVFVGVFSVDSAYERRHLIRSTYARHSRPVDPRTGLPTSNVQLRFVLGRPRLQHVRRVALEMETYNDIVVLDIQENMNRGKTYAFMRWASENATVPIFVHPLDEPRPKTGVNGIGGVLGAKAEGDKVEVGVGFKKADFVVKADDDAFIVLSELERHLRVAPRQKTYWGYLIRNLFMGGECYALSADLVSYVATSQKVSQYLTGAEDKKVAKWMRIHPNATAINWVTERCWVYDHPKAGTTYAHGFLFPDEVARVRAEGRRGLSAEEVEQRGQEHGQAFSTVTRWKERYVAPRSALTMEEEVEALVEGGGRYSQTGFRRPAALDPLVAADRVIFEPSDPRLAPSALLGAAGAAKRAPTAHEHTPPVSTHYTEPALKFGRPPSELMAHMPHVDDLPASPLKETIQAGLEKHNSRGSSTEADGKTTAREERRAEEQVFVPPPTLRFDDEDLRVRAARFLGRAHGGTVVVHYLKRSEWFLETSLVLLGRAKTWEDGLVPGLYREAAHGLGSVSSGGAAPVEGTQREVSVLRKVEWESGNKNRKKVDQVEEIEGGAGLFGEPRRYGSPVISSDGQIREGRQRDGGGRREAILRREGDEVERMTGEEKQEGGLQVDEIRKSQFGGAGWVRGKPRVRVADHQGDGIKGVFGNENQGSSSRSGGGGEGIEVQGASGGGGRGLEEEEGQGGEKADGISRLQTIDKDQNAAGSTDRLGDREDQHIDDDDEDGGHQKDKGTGIIGSFRDTAGQQDSFSGGHAAGGGLGGLGAGGAGGGD